jgi:hypothetical protein
MGKASMMTMSANDGHKGEGEGADGGGGGVGVEAVGDRRTIDNTINENLAATLQLESEHPSISKLGT